MSQPFSILAILAVMAILAIRPQPRMMGSFKTSEKYMKRVFLFFFLSLVIAGPLVAQPLPTVSTFSIVAIDPQNGDMGVAVASRYFSVGSVVPWALAGVGAVATQANVNVGYGPQAIDLLRQGLTAQQVLQKLLEEDKFEGKDGRQVAIVDAKGNEIGRASCRERV